MPIEKYFATNEGRLGCGLIRTSPYPLIPIASDRNS